VIIHKIIDLFLHFLELLVCGNRAKSVHHIEFLGQLFFLFHLLPEEILSEIRLIFIEELITVWHGRVFKPTNQRISE